MSKHKAVLTLCALALLIPAASAQARGANHGRNGACGSPFSTRWVQTPSNVIHEITPQGGSCSATLMPQGSTYTALHVDYFSTAKFPNKDDCDFDGLLTGPTLVSGSSIPVPDSLRDPTGTYLKCTYVRDEKQHYQNFWVDQPTDPIGTVSTTTVPVPFECTPGPTDSLWYTAGHTIIAFSDNGHMDTWNTLFQNLDPYGPGSLDNIRDYGVYLNQPTLLSDGCPSTPTGHLTTGLHGNGRSIVSTMANTNAVAWWVALDTPPTDTLQGFSFRSDAFSPF